MEVSEVTSAGEFDDPADTGDTGEPCDSVTDVTDREKRSLNDTQKQKAGDSGEGGEGGEEGLFFPDHFQFAAIVPILSFFADKPDLQKPIEIVDHI